METVFAVSMLIGGPIFGRFGDLFGARAALMVAFISSFLSYGVLSMADSIPMLFLSRVFAFMMHAMHGKEVTQSLTRVLANEGWATLLSLPTSL